MLDCVSRFGGAYSGVGAAFRLLWTQVQGVGSRLLSSYREYRLG